jgi:uncharacterized membrane protein HdeD (DUF308 family)
VSAVPPKRLGSAIDTEVRTLLRQGARYWWIPLVTGVAWLIVAWLVLRMKETSITTVGVLIGIVLIAAGVNEAAVAAFVPGGWKVWHIIMAVIFLLGGPVVAIGRRSSSTAV